MLHADFINNRLVISVGESRQRNSIARTLANLPFSHYNAITDIFEFSILDFQCVKQVLDSRNLVQNRIMSQRLKDKLIELEEYEKLDRKLKVKLPLKDYQVKAFKFLLSRESALLADDCGLGKTVEASSPIVYLHSQGKLEKCIVVVPKSILFQIGEDYRKFYYLNDNDIQIVKGQPKRRKELYSKKGLFKIVTYDIMRIDIKHIMKAGFDAAILSEAHRIKSWKAKRSKAAKKLSFKIPIRIAETGTPIHGRLEDLFSIMQFVRPGFFGYFKDFDKRYIKRGYFGDVRGYKNKIEVKNKLHYIMLRRRKQEVLPELSDRIYQTYFVELSGKQKKLYSDLKKGDVKLLNKDREIQLNENEFFGKVMFYQQVCDSAELISEEFKGISSKMDELKIIVNELVDSHKIVIFTQSSRMVNIIHRDIGHQSLQFTGGLSAEQQYDIVKEFENSKDKNIFIMTTAGEEGLDMPFADVIILFDRLWNPQRMSQIIQRLERIGQKNVINVINIIANAKMEKKQLEVLKERQKLFDEVIDGDRDESKLPRLDMKLSTFLDMV